MQAKGIIEPVDDPPQWCAPLVIMPKPNGVIRLCVDLSIFPILDVDTSISQVEDAQVFSKIDANWGVGQIFHIFHTLWKTQI